MSSEQHVNRQLSELFNQHVDTEIIEQRQQPGAQLTVCQMSYRPDTDSGRIRQTVLLLDAERFDLPQFFLQPENRVGTLLTGLIGFEDIDFADDPAFSDTCFLHGWAAEPVRVLFTQTMRDWFASHPGWSVRGKGRLLAIFRFRKRCRPNDIDQFIDDCMPMLPLFRDGERELDARPDLSRHATARDFAETVSGMGGLIGRSLQHQLAKLRLTEADLEEFVSQPEPRSIPPGLKRQVLGDNAALILVGGVFILAGVGAGLLTCLMPDKGAKAIGLLFLLVFPLIGGLMSGLTIRHRARKSRLLREGILCQGQIEDVSRTSTSVNNQLRFHVRIQYMSGGRKHTTQCNTYGPMVDTARARQESGEPVRVLVDPRNADHSVCLDLLWIEE